MRAIWKHWGWNDVDLAQGNWPGSRDGGENTRSGAEDEGEEEDEGIGEEDEEEDDEDEADDEDDGKSRGAY